MKIGTLDITNCKIGSTQVNEVRIGSTLVWQYASIDPDAQAFITAAAITNPTQITAINTLVVSLKANGIWTKMSAIYPFVGGTASSHKFNLKNPLDTNAAFRLVFSGGGTHSANGYLPNALNAFANTFLIPSTSLSLNSIHISFYSRTTSTGAFCDIGASNTGNNPGVWILNNLGGTSYINSNSASAVATTIYGGNTNGFFVNNRTIPTAFKFNRNASINSITQTTTSLTSVAINIGALASGVGQAYYSNRQCAFASIGDGLTDTESTNLYTAVQTFQTTLGRQV